MVVMVVVAVIAAIASVSFLKKIKAKKADIIANTVLLLIVISCCAVGIADKHYVKVMSESYDIQGGEYLDEYDYIGIVADHYTFKKSTFMSDEGRYAIAKDKIDLPAISRIYSPVRFICLKNSKFSNEKVQLVKKGAFYNEINYNSIVKVVPQPGAAVIFGYIAALMALVIYDLSKLFVMGFKNGMQAYDDHVSKDKVTL